MPGYLVFDLETRIDRALLNASLFRGQGLSDDEALAAHMEELRAKGARGIPSVVFHVPVSLAMASVGADMRLREIRTVAGDESPIAIAEEFWRIINTWSGCLVTFSGRGFDVPVLELQALKYGIAAPSHYGEKFGNRYRFQTDHHLDLYEFLTGHGATHIRGGLDALCRLCGIEGKGDVSGSDVQALYDAGRLEEIHAYCRDDVFKTYLLFLRVQVIRGQLKPQAAQELAAAAIAGR